MSKGKAKIDMEDKTQLRMKRGQLKAKITNFGKYIQDWDESIGIRALKLRLSKIEELYRDFDVIQGNLELLDNSDTQSKERQAFEDSYFDVVERAYNIIDSTESSLNVTPPAVNVAAASSENLPSVRLPVIEIQKFSGKFCDWNSFSDLFKALIINDRKLSNVQRLYYLKSSVTESALNLIKDLAITNDNFLVAWKLLTDRFENKKTIVTELVDNIITQPNLLEESAIGLHNLLDNITRNFHALSAMVDQGQMLNVILNHIVKKKLDPSTRRDWQIKYQGTETFNDMLTFLQQRCQLLDALEITKVKQTKDNTSVKYEGSRDNSYRKKDRSKVNMMTKASSSINNFTCSFCKGQHRLYQCLKFKDLDVNQKYDHVKQARLCINCLSKDHFLRQCKASMCKICNHKHNTLLHRTQKENTNSVKQSDMETSNNNMESESHNNEASIGSNTNTALTHSLRTAQCKTVLLSTARVLVRNSQGNWIECRVLLDNAAESTFITQDFARKLNLELKGTDVPVISINNTVTKVNKQLQLKLRSKMDDKFKVNLSCLVVPTIAGNIPSKQIDRSYFEVPDYIKLADPEYYVPTEVQMLLNANVFWEVLQEKTLNLGDNLPVLRETRLGWLITGTVMTMDGEESNRYNCHLTTTSKLEKQIERFWEIENVESEVKVNSSSTCEALFKETVKREETGRYIVTLPRKLSHKQLGESYSIAVKRMHSLERKFEKSPDIKLKYQEFMKQYIDLGHMTEVDESNIKIPGQEVYYLPHFAVIRESSTSTPLRTVFNASQKTTSGISLNDTLQIGPVIQESLFNILLRFRMFNYVLSSDIKKMYRQILITPEQRDLQRICWRANKEETMKIFQLNTVTYGMNSSPFLAQRTLKQLYLDEAHAYPLAIKSQNSWYMDDCLFGTDQKAEAILLRQEITELLKKGGFHVCKWVTNDVEILNSIPSEDRAIKDDKEFDKDDNNRMLGMLWKNKSDVFTYSAQQTQKVCTKRTILSNIASLWDPLGMLSPLLIKAKLIMQKIWNRKLEWDDIIDADIQSEWNEYVNKIQYVNQIQIPRPLKFMKEYTQYTLHVYADASMVAYGSAVYLVVQYVDNTKSSRLVTAKGKVVPLNKQYTIPRLETQAAYFATKLGSSVAKVLSIENSSVFYYSDSQILLARLQRPSNLEEIFVINRISKILEVSQASQWHYVGTKENPADIITRTIDPLKLSKTKLWWSGPDNLLQEEFSIEEAKVDEVRTKDTVCFQSRQVMKTKEFFSSIWERFSKFQKLIHVVAMCLRFVHNCKKEKDSRITDGISLTEIQTAKIVIIKQVQKESFSEDVKKLSKGDLISIHSKLKQLNPFLDNEGILRVGGRIQNADLPEEQKHPIIMPANHRVTRLMISQEHLKNLHAGPQNLLHIIRQSYWVLQGRRTIRSELSRCHNCLRVKPRLASQIMGNLPQNRVTVHRAFSVVGTDYCGPISIKQSNRRNAAILKGYIVIFVCMICKAIHLDIAEDLSTKAFLNVFQRFISRRGKPSIVYSDNAKNYVGANKELQQLHNFINDQQTKNEFRRHAAMEGIDWRFNPARAAHEGGLWESAVKGVKFHLKRVVGNVILQKEQLYTLLTQVEACLNSRPISPITEDPEDVNVLTPAHFLIGGTLKGVTQAPSEEIPQNRLSLWQQSQRMLQHFWKRWTREYLSSLQMRNKWFTNQSNVKKDQLVWIQDNNAPPLLWKMGRIERVYPDQHGVVRHIEVRTPTGVVTRSIRNVAPLPVEN